MIDISLLAENGSLLLKGFVLPLGLMLASIIGSTLIGTVFSVAAKSSMKWPKWLSTLYVALFRSSPLPLLLLIIFIGMSYYYLDVSMFWSAAAGLCVYHGAFITEILRSGLESVPSVQVESGRLLGLNRFQQFRWIIFPQSFPLSLPPLIGQYISLLKDTSIASVIGLTELMGQAEQIVARTGDALTIYAAVAVLYFAVSFPVSHWVDRQQIRLERSN